MVDQEFVGHGIKVWMLHPIPKLIYTSKTIVLMKSFTKKRIFIPILALSVFIVGTGFVKSDFFEIAKQIEIFTTLFKELNMNYVDETNPAELIF